jgi:hypothetical protein
MAQQDLVALTGSTLIGLESTFGTTSGSMVRAFPRNGGTMALTQSILPVDTEQVKLVKRDKSVRGYKSGTAAFTCDSFLDATLLTSAGSASTTWLGTLLKAALGGESAAAGSTFAIGSSSSSLIAGSGHGSRFPVGQVVLADVGDVPEVAIVKSVSTDTLTPLFNLSGSPTTGQDIRNTHCYYFTDTSTQSLTIQHALAQDSSHQWTLNGCIVSGLSIDLARDGRMSYAFQFAGADWTGPSSQSISTAASTNALTGPIPNVNAVCLLQSLSTTTRVHVPFHSIALNLSLGNSHVQEMGGTTQGVVGAMRNAAPSANATLTMRSDLARYTDWDSDTDYVLVYAVPSGSGASKRYTGFVLYCNIEARPSRTVVDGREMTQLELRGRHNTMQSAVTTDLALSPFVLFEG